MSSKPISDAIKVKNSSPLSFEDDWPFFLGLAAVLAMLWAYGYKSFWLPADEGVYAHCADRVLDGQLPERDFVTVKAGLYLWTDVLAFKTLGVKLSSLRWPMLIVAVLQTPMVYLLLRPLGRWTAVLGVIWAGAIGMPAVQNPSSGLFAKIFVIGALLVAGIGQPWKSRSRLLVLGALIGLVFACRQLDAAYLGCGLLSWVLARKELEDRTDWSFLGRGLLLCSAVGVGWYGLGRSDLFGKIAFGLAPTLLAWQAFGKGRPSRRIVNRILLWGGSGFVLAFLPLAIPNALAGNFSNWFSSVFLKSMDHLDFQYFTTYFLSDIVTAVGTAVPLIRSPVALVQLLTWLFLLFVSFGVGVFCLIQRYKSSEVPAYVFCGPFLAMGSVHFEIAIYLLWSIPIVVLGGIYCLNRLDLPLKPKGVPIVGLVLFCGFFNSVVGKPVWLREQKDFVLTGLGGRLPLVYLGGAADLYIPGPYADFYQRSIAMIQAEVDPTETIFCFPNHPEWYFLTRRKNATRYIVAGAEILDEPSFAEAQATLDQTRPKVIVFRHNDLCTTPYTERLRTWLDEDYEIIHQEADYDFLRRKELP